MSRLWKEEVRRVQWIWEYLVFSENYGNNYSTTIPLAADLERDRNLLALAKPQIMATSLLRIT